MLFRFATTQFQDNTCEENTLRFTEGCVCVCERETKRENVMRTSVGKIWVTLIERKLANAIVCIV